ncbi:acylphosphatase [Oenococcus oeni]|nr:acylphosphatase [Oenococcus oeni]EJN99355.1 acylphosphatase [Oenococcus oeni AWRIB418]KDE87756.1 acylphosphatase [Oenococcus oeni]KEP88229.1 acylphosphatase [Oenococcus oeni IOEB_0501]KGH57316.1 acylphosphatase [Oenococcus oeni IOEB_9805]KGH65789.1 acylphosphatase [Oenococcus oeni IOEB_C23]
MNFIKKFKNKHVFNQESKDELPKFKNNDLVRYRIVFSGIVQHVGFRFEAEQMAVKLQLTGWVKNIANGTVEMEIQGSDEKINSLLQYMNSLKWIEIDRMSKDPLPVLHGEKNFDVRQ